VQDAPGITSGTFEPIAIARTARNEDLAGQAAKLDQCDLVTAPRFDDDVRASSAHGITDRIRGFYSTVNHDCTISVSSVD
jgi:hypothetical protein